MKTIFNLLISAIFRNIAGNPGRSAGWQPALVRINPTRTHYYRAVPANDFRPRQTGCRPAPRSGAFTLIELLVVIAIIGILAAMLFPAISKAKTAAQKGTAKTDMSNLGMATKTYESDYNGRLPAPGIPTGVQDVTYGFVTNTTVNGHYALADNRDVIAVLLNLETFANGDVTTNKGKIFNARGLTPFSPKYAKDVDSPGVGPDGNFRDPWGRMYVMSMDTSLNERCRDNLYSRQLVSRDGAGQKGFYGLSNPNPPGTTDEYEFAGQYLIWSFGPDKQVDPAIKANTGFNKDNVLGWQP